MTPGSFDLQTAREITGDSFSRIIEVKARQDADMVNFDPPNIDGLTYWENARGEMRIVVYREQYLKRLARNARKASSTNTQTQGE